MTQTRIVQEIQELWGRVVELRRDPVPLSRFRLWGVVIVGWRFAHLSTCPTVDRGERASALRDRYGPLRGATASVAGFVSVEPALTPNATDKGGVPLFIGEKINSEGSRENLRRGHSA